MTSELWKKKLKMWITSGRLEQFLPEIASLKGINQPEEFHTEGDVFTHTLLAVDAVDPSSDVRVFWSVLLHDVGKATTTKIIDGRLRAWGHDKVGAEMVPEILHRFDLKHLSADVAWLVKHHGFMLSWGGELNTLTNKQKRFCDHHLFNLLVEVATADATASHGKSTKLDLLRNIVELCNID